MLRFKCTCAYDGTLFHGFQRQENLRTVQEEIEKVLLKITKKETIIFSSGRTDAQVHAIGQVFHFDTDIDIFEWNMKKAINCWLPKDIHINEVIKVDNNFHARFCATSKEYHYLIDFGKYDPIKRNYRYYCPYKNVDIELFKAALLIYKGSHDFRSFTKNKKIEDTVRKIIAIDFLHDKDLLTIKIIGSGFMHNMVRILVAMSLEVARHKLSIDELKSILEQKNRILSPKILPSSGLYLYKVNYE